MGIYHVQGDKKGFVMLYALSTCVWCKKTKSLLEQMNIDYFFVDMDLLEDPERSETKNELKRWNPDCTFPSLVIDQESCIVGFDEQKIRDAFK
ncbi:MAG: glutaredoxin family protein [Deltaproteobacteria bacterium]|nr:glutaredoxin family protein [Deltaproteobacteria bacterium]